MIGVMQPADFVLLPLLLADVAVALGSIMELAIYSRASSWHEVG